MRDSILKVFYPPRCVVCHKILSHNGEEKLCDTCRRNIRRVTEPRCKRCSKPISHMEKELCDDCQSRSFSVERGFALYPYDKYMKKAVINFKYKGELSGGEYFSGKLVQHYGRWIKKISPDVIIPVPVHKKRLRFRGFNQAGYMAEQIGRQLGIAVDGDYLVRNGDTKPQKSLDVKARIENLQKGFAIRGNTHKRYEKVLLVDDIYTTGATLEACGKVLKKAGTDSIYFLCLCIGRGD